MEGRAAAGVGGARDFGILPKTTVKFRMTALSAQLAEEGPQHEWTR